MKTCPHCGGDLPGKVRVPLRRTPLERARAGLRDQGYTIRGNSNPYIGYAVAKFREAHHIKGEEALIDFAKKRGVEI